VQLPALPPQLFLRRFRRDTHALDHLTHLFRYFRKGEERFQATDAIRVVTGSDPRTLEEFFRSNAEFISTAGQ
jgi:hypothetical protein